MWAVRKGGQGGWRGENGCGGNVGWTGLWGPGEGPWEPLGVLSRGWHDLTQFHRVVPAAMLLPTRQTAHRILLTLILGEPLACRRPQFVLQMNEERMNA